MEYRKKDIAPDKDDGESQLLEPLLAELLRSVREYPLSQKIQNATARKYRQRHFLAELHQIDDQTSRICKKSVLRCRNLFHKYSGDKRINNPKQGKQDHKDLSVPYFTALFLTHFCLLLLGSDLALHPYNTFESHTR